MTNNNDVSINIGKNANRAEIEGGQIRSKNSFTPTENKASITIGGDADDAKLKGGKIDESLDITELKAEIKQLLNELAENPRTAKKAVVVEVIREEINDNPNLRHRLMSAFQAGGIETLKAIFNHPAISIPVETVKGFLEG